MPNPSNTPYTTAAVPPATASRTTTPSVPPHHRATTSRGTPAMSEFSFHTEKLAAQQIAERVANAKRSAIPGRTRPHGRHGLAQRLHQVADRLDGYPHPRPVTVLAN